MTARRKLAGAALKRALARVRLLSMDCDGVLTDGGLYYGDDGRILRKFNVKDGVGLQQVLAAGIEIAVVSAGRTDSIRHRCAHLGIRHVFMDAEDKLATLSGLCRGLGLDLAQAAHIGDDLNDIPVLRSVGLAFSVADGADAARAEAAYITGKGGGAGAVREVCDLLLAARSPA